jgi:hypothetical protein
MAEDFIFFLLMIKPLGRLHDGLAKSDEPVL